MGDFQILEIVDIFTDLTENQRREIYNICNELVCSQGTTIVKENTSSTEMYIILEGEVEVVVREAAGLESEHKLATLDRGASFGEVTLVTEGPRIAGARRRARRGDPWSQETAAGAASRPGCG